ncbi:MAG: hypothetical protein RJB39_697 [Candidatus Parcubacteria bacterium]|jgi:hypothetical protein
MSKQEADNTKKITATFLRKHMYFTGWRKGIITWTRTGIWGDETQSSVGIEVLTHEGLNHLRIHYTQTDNDTGKKQDFDYKIPLTTSPCRFGGKRYWFICPWYKNGIYCGKRVGTLYKDGDYFACRHCYNLTYSSRKVNRRFKYYPLFQVLTLEEKTDKLEQQIKRRYYRGRPTRKQRQLNKLHKYSNLNYQHYAELLRRKLL